jgi:threonine dehydratase
MRMPRFTIRLKCSGCGTIISPRDPLPFRCPKAGETGDVDHVLRRVVDMDLSSGDDATTLFQADGANPFRRYRPLLYAYQAARSAGFSDEDYLTLVDELDAAVERVDGRGFRVTPFSRSPALEQALGLTPEGALWVKNETGNVSGSHKARHLMGIMLWMRVMEKLGAVEEVSNNRFAIASCGNAALAAAVVARASAVPLDVFVPPDADPAVLARLRQMGAHLTMCDRRAGETGDPCYLRFREAIGAGALPFSVQGPDNGLTLEGGLTLGYELISGLLAEDEKLDRLFIQVGGGALASSCVQALEEARQLGVIDRLPRVHAVQTEGGSPLTRAYERVAAHVLKLANRSSSSRPALRGLAEEVQHAGGDFIEKALTHAANHRSEFMWPWETAPRSIATGILDDETYDWLAVVRAMLVTGGFPVIATERNLRKANDLARDATQISVDPTGTAGLAGWMTWAEDDIAARREHAAVLFTGIIR